MTTECTPAEMNHMAREEGVARPERFELPTTWFEARLSSRQTIILSRHRPTQQIQWVKYRFADSRDGKAFHFWLDIVCWQDSIPQKSRSAVVIVFTYLQDNLVTSQAVPIECTTNVGPEWPLSRGL